MNKKGKCIRVLWTCNIVLPSVARDFQLAESPFGGWLESLLALLRHHEDICLGVAMLTDSPVLKTRKHGGITFYAMPRKRLSKLDVSQKICDQVLEEFQPDVLHAQGSEMLFTSRFMRTWKGPKIVAIQGVLKGIEPHYLGGIGFADTFGKRMPVNLLFLLAMHLNKAISFRRRLKAEAQSVGSADIIVGRTAWDKAYSSTLNGAAEYVACGEVLRESFGQYQWNAERCEKHSIFLGNGSVPLKGAHVAVKALKLLLPKYPDAKILVASSSAGSGKRTLRSEIGYVAYLRGLVAKLGLEQNVTFLGALDEREMACTMVGCHVFVLASLIENSPNTLGEAMRMGVPSVASFVGGVPSLASDEIDALLYRSRDHVMLAHQVGRIFDSNVLANSLSLRARERGSRNHDSNKIGEVIHGLYKKAAAAHWQSNPK